MKKLLIGLLLTGFTLPVIAQEKTKGDWSVGVDATVFSGGLTLGLFINKHLNTRWQVGVMPFTRIFNNDSGFSKTTATTFGLNVNSRFYLVEEKLFLPYAYGYGGYGETYNTFEYPTSTNRSTDRFFNASVGLGAQVLLGQSGWSLDANVGYLGYYGVRETDSFNTLIYAFGIFKRFGKKK